ncbi:nucleolar GTP-binding protein [Histoplasma capsulatum H143]|uniref:Nucleolar GTP-binding protein n=1 Tax=Ajellomyces capsulatus (strain H143) TaxID=544712 RepID=C6H342_AJECH|nr:nucleolar GTP-binding protein [Histoplasma capsulatum H143]
MKTTWKEIQPVPSSQEFLDIVLSRTQRRLPTQIRSGFKISRIRAFYTRKVKFTQETFCEKFQNILDGFPRLQDIHPFQKDLMNTLYDADHFRIALGQLSTAKHLVETVSRDYVRLIKYAQSLFQCKQLKRAALGRMATICRRLKDPLVYLEQVRQHLGRLPSIDPNTRTLLICGYPNVGKSSFLRNITKADVDVQPYAFTTKSLFVGHFDYKYLRFQAIDTPGILDHPLEEMNTIEMQSITAIAHLRSAILYFMDLSEQSVHSLKKYDKNDPNKRRLARDTEEENGGAGVFNVDLKENYLLANDEWKHDKIPEVWNGKNIYDFVDPDIESKLAALEEEEEKLEAEGYYDSDESVEDAEEADIRMKADLIREKQQLIRNASKMRKSLKNRALIPRSAKARKLSEMQSHLESIGFDAASASTRVQGQTQSQTQSRGRGPTRSDMEIADAMDIDGNGDDRNATRQELLQRAKSRARSQAPTNRLVDGITDMKSRSKADKMAKLAQIKMNRMARQGEADRHTTASLPKHLFSGKRGMGKTQRR